MPRMFMLTNQRYLSRRRQQYLAQQDVFDNGQILHDEDSKETFIDNHVSVITSLGTKTVDEDLDSDSGFSSTTNESHGDISADLDYMLECREPMPSFLLELMTQSPTKDSGRDVPEMCYDVSPNSDSCDSYSQSNVYAAARALTELMNAPLNLSKPQEPLEDHYCLDCGKKYSTSSNLARHRQTHRSVNDKKARKCPHCEKVYVSMPAYSMHVRTHNQGCECPYCGKKFSRPWLLQGHIRTHTGEKPFSCPQCTKAFADKSNLRAHIQTHSTDKPYVCERCGKAFALKSYLYKHEESSCMRGQRFYKHSAHMNN